MITVGSLTFVAKIIATVLHLVIANQFGTNDEIDAYIIAFLIPSLTINVLAGSLNAAFMPAFVQAVETHGREKAQQLFSSVMVCSILIIAIVSALLILIAPYIIPILGSGFSSSKLELTRSLFYILLPVLIFNGLATIWISILNAGEKFALAAITPSVTPLAAIFFLITTARYWGIYSLALGTAIGFAFETLILAWAIKRNKFSLIPRWHGRSPEIIQVMKQFLPMIVGALLMSSTDFIDKAMAAMLDPGSVSALNYGNKIVSFVLGVGAFGLGTAVFPHFSRMAANQDWENIKHTLKSYVTLVVGLTVPFTAIFFFFSEPLVGLLFERGAFVSSDTQIVGKIQAFYVLQIPFYIVGIIGVRLLSALAKNQILMTISAINVIANVAGNYILIKFFGVAGISLSTSIVYVISTSLILISLYSLLKKRGAFATE